MVSFFVASAAASSAYLTVSETFPLEVRALAIAFFYAIGTGIGGVAGPWLFGLLIDTGSRTSVLGGYLFGAVLMIAAALVAGRWALAAERQALGSVARPLAARDLRPRARCLHRLAQPHRTFEVDRDELRDAAFRHGDTVEPVHARHGDRVVRDDDEAGVGRFRHFVEQVAEALDVVI